MENGAELVSSQTDTEGMETYLGTKLIKAKAATYHDFVREKGEDVAHKDDSDGYIVAYADVNGSFENAYKSFSPKDVFEAAYRKTDGLSFGLAVDSMRKGGKVKLPAWGEDVFIQIQFPDDNSKMTAPYFYVTSRFGLVPWIPTMIEQLSEAWVIVEVIHN